MLDGKEHVVNTMAMDDLEILFAYVDEVRGWIGRHAEFNVYPDHSRGELKLINDISHEEIGRPGNQAYAFRGSTFACYISEYT